MSEKGHISIDTDNILPIIKKWLYSEKEIFLRELVANASDALTKAEKLALVGEISEAPEAKIAIEVDKKKRVVRITDTGIGLTADEIKRYINQVAFSGVKEFVEKYQGKDDENQIIGHFGLGFYSAFMVASEVEIDSLSCRPGSEAAHWRCQGNTEFELTPSKRRDVGTTITLHISDDAAEMLEPDTLRRILKRYCAFIRFPITLDGEQINETQPLWTKNPASITEDEYKKFYNELFPLAGEPLFWIHLNVDFPFKLRGVLFFPKFNHEFDAAEGQVKLYCNQVFVEDNAKELVPEYLMLLKGVIDCPDLPLNVSRSYLQNDAQVKKISEHISKKVADKLAGMAKTERETFEKHWEDIHGFVKYCMLRDPKFYERLKDHVIYKVAGGGYTTLEDYLVAMKGKSDKIIYATDEVAQAPFIKMLQEHDMQVILATVTMDRHFLPYMEMQSARKLQFQRIDADVVDHLVDPQKESKLVDPTDNKTDAQKLEEIFSRHLGREKLKIKVQALKSEKLPAMLLVQEDQRRMQEMSQFMPFAGTGMGEPEQTLIINSTCPAVKSVLTLARGLSADTDLPMVVRYIYDLAAMQQGRLTPEAMTDFMERSVSVLGRLGAR